MKIKKYMKIPRDQYLKKIPFENREEPIKISKDELDYMEKLAKEGSDSETENLVQIHKNPTLEDFINKKTLDVELNVPDLAAGIPTRKFTDQALGRLVLKRYPKFLNMTNAELSSILRELVYPKMSDANRQHGYPTPNKIRYKLDSEKGYTGAFSPTTGELIVPKDQSNTKKIDIEQKARDIGTILHELGHNLDHLAQYESDWKSDYEVFKNPKFEKILKVKDKTTTPLELSKIKSYAQFQKAKNHINALDIDAASPEGRKILQTYSPIIRTPNFEDYNWKKGDFDSDIVETPLSKYEEVGGDHHIGRPFSLENFKNLSKGSLDSIVRNENKFKTLRRKLA